MENGLNILGILTGIGALSAGLGIAYAQFRSADNKESLKTKDDLIVTLRETALAEKDKAERLAEEKVTLINSHQEQINLLNNKIGKLQGLYEANEQQKKEYLAILQGRDPSQQKFMELMVAAAKNSTQLTDASQKYMRDTTIILGEIRTFMEALNKKADATEAWHDDIDKATKADSGKPLRKAA